MKNPLQKFVRTAQCGIFAMFFMVLDLRLTKVGTQRSPFFFAFLSETASDSVPFFTSLHKKTLKTGTPGK